MKVITSREIFFDAFLAHCITTLFFSNGIFLAAISFSNGSGWGSGIHFFFAITCSLAAFFELRNAIRAWTIWKQLKKDPT